ncbi:MAG: photosynthetic reaction center cytochrome c subunit family protein [Chloroflexota bacterium]
MIQRYIGERNAYMLITLGISGLLVLSAWWVIGFVNGVVQPDDPAGMAINELSPLYVNFRVDVDEWVSAESYLAMAAYQAEFPQPRNVRVLVGESTQNINGYMMSHFVGGLNVNCTYCHNINNFAAGSEWTGEDVPEPTEPGAAPHPDWVEHKDNARIHLEMTQDLNVNWLANLGELTDEKVPSGAQIICATCHNGQAEFDTYPAEQQVLPDDFRLPLGEDPNGDLYILGEGEGILHVNARTDISLDTVNYQQQIMYHMNASMNVGCTHCHNSRYFPSNEVPAIHYGLNMIQMSQYIFLTYSDSMGGQMPSCSMCHQEQIIPGGAAVSADVLPDALVTAPDNQMMDEEEPMDDASDDMGDDESSDVSSDETGDAEANDSEEEAPAEATEEAGE